MNSQECIYDVCWKGKCKNPTVGDSEFCENHIEAKCCESISTFEKQEHTFSISPHEVKEILERHLGIQDIEVFLQDLYGGKQSISSFDIVGKGTGVKRVHTKCGEQAVGDCHSHAGPGVCGTPLCQEHKETHKH